MRSKYRIELGGHGYVVMDAENGTVGNYETRQEAQQGIQRCQKEDAIWETSKLLIDMSIKTLMQIHEVDRDTATDWISSAGEFAK
jgi:hypothetical protein